MQSSFTAQPADSMPCRRCAGGPPGSRDDPPAYLCRNQQRIPRLTLTREWHRIGSCQAQMQPAHPMIHRSPPPSPAARGGGDRRVGERRGGGRRTSLSSLLATTSQESPLRAISSRPSRCMSWHSCEKEQPAFGSTAGVTAESAARRQPLAARLRPPTAAATGPAQPCGKRSAHPARPAHSSGGPAASCGR